MTTALPAEVEEKLKVYRALQTDLLTSQGEIIRGCNLDENLQTSDIQTIYGRKQQTLSQFNENTLVKGELDLLAPKSKVYKLVGPILINVDLEEAKENVGKRLEFIEAEVHKVDASIVAKQVELKAVGDEIAAIQQRMQGEAATAARQIAATAMA